MQFVNNINKEALQKRLKARKEDLRGSYFRDTTAIIHSYPFRRLRHKTQVFFSPSNDHICTRIEHVMHVATIASTICRALGLDSDLAWAISLGHDLGHTPFGHVGEKIVEAMLAPKGGFAHEMYSLRVVDYLIHYGKGINLTYAVRDGIVTHCGEKFEQRIEPDFTVKDLKRVNTREFRPATWEGVVVRMSDKVAYLGRDMEDAVQLKVIDADELPREVAEILGRRNSDIIDTLVNDIVSTSNRTGTVGFSDTVYAALLILKEFNYRRIYNNERLANYHAYFERILTTLYKYLEGIFSTYGLNYEKYKMEYNILAVRFGDYIRKMKVFYEEVDESYDQAVIDYLAGMTDDYAIECISEIMIPKEFEHQFHALLYKGTET